MVPFSPTRPPHAPTGAATTTASRTSTSTATPATRRMGSLPRRRLVREGQTDGGAARFPRARDFSLRYLARMPELRARVDASLLAALHEQAASSGAPVDHLVERALAE